jgi:hypothetical protein
MKRSSKTAAVAVVAAVVAASAFVACGGSEVTIPDSDASTSTTPGTEGGTSSGNDGGPTGNTDGNVVPDPDAGGRTDGNVGRPDGAVTTDAGTRFMTTCTMLGTPGDCPQGLICANFAGTGKYCTRTCTKATEATDCPKPSTGCSGGYCAPP